MSNRWYRLNFSVPVVGLYVYRIIQQVAQSGTIGELGDILQSPTIWQHLGKLSKYLNYNIRSNTILMV